MGRRDPARRSEHAVACVAAACGLLPVDLHAYCVLPGHFHLLVRAAIVPAHAMARAVAGASLPGIRIVGVTLGRHLMEVSRYLHLNPVGAGLVARAEDWPFSSLRFYLGEPTTPPWLVTEALLGRFGTAGARHRYRAYIQAGLDPGTRDASGRPRWEALFAAGSDVENDAWRIEPVCGPPAGAPAPGARAVAHPDAALAHAVAARFGVTVAALRSSRRGGSKGALARGALMHEARARGGARLPALAAWTGYRTVSGASGAVERFRRATGAGGLG